MAAQAPVITERHTFVITGTRARVTAGAPHAANLREL
jgi:hypothetical protein